MAAKFAVELRRLNREVTDEERLLEITKEYGINSSQLAQSLAADDKSGLPAESRPSPPKNTAQTGRVTTAAVSVTDAVSPSASGPFGGASTPSADESATRPPAQREKTVREKIWQIFSEPTSSRLAMLIAAIVVAMIAVSVTAFIVQTLPEYVFSTVSLCQDYVSRIFHCVVSRCIIRCSWSDLSVSCCGKIRRCPCPRPHPQSRSRLCVVAQFLSICRTPHGAQSSTRALPSSHSSFCCASALVHPSASSSSVSRAWQWDS